MRLAFLLFISFCTLASAQTKAKTAITDEWDALDEAFVALLKIIETNDKAGIKAASMPMVDCIDCVGKPDFNEEGYFVTPDIFLFNITKNFTQSPVYKAVVKRGYTFSTITLKDFKPKIMPRDYPADLKLYEVWIPTYKKDELSKGHPGTSHAFQFVKIGGKFKFYGLTSIP